MFRGHRAPSHLAQASIASLATGLPVPVHALEDPGARLSPRTPLLGRALAPFGVATAMFTEVPTTGAAFGFAHDWTNYAARSPLDGPSVAFDEIGRWIESHAGKKAFVLAHARGAHPPWEVSSAALEKLPPEGYAGPVDVKHVVGILAKARKGLLRLNENDRARLIALQTTALDAQDKKLDALIEALRGSGALDKALLVVTGDAPFVIPPAAPDPKAAASASIAAPAKEFSKEISKETETPGDALSIPLVVRFPGGVAAGRVVDAITDPTDVAATILAAFGGPVDGLAGRDLALLALDDEPARDVPRLSDDGRGYQLTWGDVRLVGVWGKPPRLEPRNGGEDLRAKRPFEYLAAWGLAAEARAAWLSARAKGPGREPATIDPATQAALDSWERSR
ncbi:MAG: sulfatase-like hydrolase/transferase [Deltaproteobacteria bacterium]|nr:sulfatase-like hydrolase/transferase [Deltaproteobacteria bacterium]